MSLDPKGKYLRQEGSGQIYVWSETLAKRADMRPFNPVTMKLETDLKPSKPKEEIELQGKKFVVETELAEMIYSMLGAIEELKPKSKDTHKSKKGK